MGLKPLEKRPYANLEINATEVTNVDFFMNHPWKNKYHWNQKFLKKWSLKKMSMKKWGNLNLNMGFFRNWIRDNATLSWWINVMMSYNVKNSIYLWLINQSEDSFILKYKMHINWDQTESLSWNSTYQHLPCNLLLSSQLNSSQYLLWSRSLNRNKL